MNLPNELKLIAWNPNGIRSLFIKNSNEVKKLCGIYDPDIIVWNEIKGNLSKHDEIEKVVTNVLPNYKWIWNHAEKAGRHGVAISYKPHINILSINYGFTFDQINGSEEREPEGRLITLELDKTFIVGLYAVNSGIQELKRLSYKIDWIQKLLFYMNNLRKKKNVVVIGDWNIAPTELDVHNPKRLENCAGYTVQERSLFKIIQNEGWVDVFRKQNPNEKEYTYFSGTTKDGKKYGGWRIDHAIVNSEMNLDHCKFKILKEYNGSDHVPIFFHISNQPIIEIIRPSFNARLQIVK